MPQKLDVLPCYFIFKKLLIGQIKIKTCMDNIQLPGVPVKDSTALLDQISQHEVKEAIASKLSMVPRKE